MNDMTKNEKTTVRVDTYTRVCLTAITVLLTLLVIGLWSDMGSLSESAHAASKSSNRKAQKAGFRDAEARRAILSEGRWGTSSSPNKFAAEQERTNTRLDELISLFRDGKARVRIENNDR